MKRELNLATRPFLNPRPVVRLAVALWVLGLLVAAFNVRLYLSHYSGSGANRAREQELEATLSRERAAVKELKDELGGYDIEWQNQQADFLNAKIAQRSFSWSVLFDRLGEALPADVRLNSLSPTFSEGRGGRTEVLAGEVLLVIRGQAKSSEVLLEFIDSLFAHPSFRGPNLASESLQDGGLLDFSLSVIYRRGSNRLAVEETVAAEADGEGAEEAGAVEGAESADSAAATPVDDEDEKDTAPPLASEAVSE